MTGAFRLPVNLPGGSKGDLRGTDVRRNEEALD